MANLLFKPTELLNELAALQKLADEFLDQTAPYRLEELTSDIQGLQSNGGTMTLSIPKDRPLKTAVSAGDFEPQGRSSNRGVYGTVSGVWEIEMMRHRIPDSERPNRRIKPVFLIGFTGLASTVITVFDKDGGDPLACWNMELGHADAPGCFFHTHTFASVDHKFPVPRHPNVFPTPMSAVGFVLGELFQDRWEEAVSGGTHSPNCWRSIQKKRLTALLTWQLEQVKATTSSPWCALKVAKPAAEIFL